MIKPSEIQVSAGWIAPDGRFFACELGYVRQMQRHMDDDEYLSESYKKRAKENE